MTSINLATPHEPPDDIASEERNLEEMIAEARQLYHEGRLEECLKLLHEVQKIEPSDKIQRKIERIKAYLSGGDMQSRTSVHDSPSPDVVTIAEGFSLPRGLYEKLYPYQREGVHWLWKLHNTAPGGVLADDMGLGKTVQVISFLCGLFLSQRHSFTALVVMPVSVLVTWESELKRWAPALHVCVFHDANRQTRLRYLSSIQRQGGILLTTYGMVASNMVDLTSDFGAIPQFLSTANRNTPNERQGPEFQWTYLVLDEAHKIKNPGAKTTKAILSVSAKHKILLTGTAIQNNLSELWSLYNCTHSGRLLGRMQTFKMEYEKPITRAREKDANRAERAHGLLMAQSLRKLIDPYFLRRTKAEVLSSSRNVTEDLEASTSKLLSLQLNEMPKKSELIVWLYLRDVQERTYRDFLQLEQVKELLLKSVRRSPLMELVILKKLCDHPRLLSRDQCLSLNLDSNHSPSGQFRKHQLPPAKQLMEESGKLYFLSILMNSFLSDAEQQSPYPPRTLIFSQSMRLLDMAEKVILALNQLPENVNKSRFHRVLRLDGRLNKVEERLEVIRLFEQDNSYTAMLLTTQVGGVGLTLIAANRVIILDPSWNPATDAQAVDRAYRIGQKSNVLVYRLITCATVEEKIYRRQIFKDSVIRQTTSSGRNKSDHDPYRYFTRQDLRELFTLTNPRVSTTQQQLSKLHEAVEKWNDPWLLPHLTYLTGDEMRDFVFGISFHDLMFTRQEVHDPSQQATGDEALHEQEALRNRQIAAEYAIARECAESTTSYSGPTASPHRPADGIFLVPSEVNTHRPMFNRRHLGVPATHITIEQPDVPRIMQNPRPVDLTDQLTASLEEMSISQAPNSPSIACISSHSSNHSPSCVIVSDDECATGESDNANPSKSPSESVSTRHDLVTLERNISSSKSSASYAHTPQSKKTSVHSAPSTDSPLPSSMTFFKTVTNNVFRSTPTSSRSGPQPMLLGTPLSNPQQEGNGTRSISALGTNAADRQHTLDRSRENQSSSTSESSSSSSAPTPSSKVNEIPACGLLMDITAEVDDDRLHQTVHMQSLQEILAKSGLHTSPCNTEDAPVSSEPSKETNAGANWHVSMSHTQTDSVEQNVIGDSIEIIEDSVIE